MKLELQSGVVPGPIDDAAIERALGQLKSGGGYPSFAVLCRDAADEQDYVQAQIDGDGFAVEKREGHAGAHFIAMRPASPDAPQRERKWSKLGSGTGEHDSFTLAELIEIFRSYVNRSEPTFWKWVPMEFSE